MLKELLKELLLDVGLYYKINGYRFRHDQRNTSQKAFYSTILSRDDLVFDVGANIGQRAEIFSELSRRVIAFEPQAVCIRHLKSRFAFRSNVVIERIALSDVEGETEIYESTSHTLTSMSHKFIDSVSQGMFKDYQWKPAVLVKTKSLDQMIATYGLPRLIKIDVEGYELNVLNGLSHPVRWVTFEYTPGLLDETEKCVRRMNQISGRYLFNYCLGENLSFVLAEHIDFSTFVDAVLPQVRAQGQFGDIYAVLNERG
jgi:FkbM family methyltransferase